MVEQKTEARSQFGLTLMLLLFTRLMVNIARRFPYPFLPAISRELNVPLSSTQSAVSLQLGIGVTSPAFGVLAERFGRKQVMCAGLMLMAASAAVGAALPQFATFALMMLLFGVGKMLFDPAMQAYIGDRVPYHQRGRTLGILELAWAGSLLSASWAGGWLLAYSSLRVMFLLIALGLALAAGLIWLLLPEDHTQHTTSTVPHLSMLQGWRILRQHPAALAALGFAFCASGANELVFINYSAFMETSFNLQTAVLGTITIVIAAAEVVGEFTVIGISDRLGKRRMALIGTSIASLCYFILPQLHSDLNLALICIFVMFVTFEMGIVASIPIYTEVLPGARAVMLSSILGAVSLGRLLGSLVGNLLYNTTQNFSLIGLVALTIGAIGVILMWRYVKPDPNRDIVF